MRAELGTPVPAQGGVMRAELSRCYCRFRRSRSPALLVYFGMRRYSAGIADKMRDFPLALLRPYSVTGFTPPESPMERGTLPSHYSARCWDGLFLRQGAHAARRVAPNHHEEAAPMDGRPLGATPPPPAKRGRNATFHRRRERPRAQLCFKPKGNEGCHP